MPEVRRWTESLTFRHPLFLKRIGEPLPAGTYEVTFEEHTFMIGGRPKKQIMRCAVEMPASMLGPNMLSATADVDPNELRLRHFEDQQKQ